MHHPRTEPAATSPGVLNAGPVRVLVLDDQRFDRHRMARLCSGLDMTTEISNADSLSALAEALVADRYDLIFLDYLLPDGNGLQALDMVRLSPMNCNAAIIMVAGEGMEGVAEEALRGGCSDYILKDDLSPAAFRRATTNALQKSRLTIGMSLQSMKRAETEEILRQFSTECARDIKPMVSRMMRQLRALRDPDTVDREDWHKKREGIEASCMRLWEFLVDLENYSGDDLDLPEEDAVPGLDNEEADKVKPRRAPSPFGRSTH